MYGAVKCGCATEIALNTGTHRFRSLTHTRISAINSPNRGISTLLARGRFYLALALRQRYLQSSLNGYTI